MEFVFYDEFKWDSGTTEVLFRKKMAINKAPSVTIDYELATICINVAWYSLCIFSFDDDVDDGDMDEPLDEHINTQEVNILIERIRCGHTFTTTRTYTIFNEKLSCTFNNMSFLKCFDKNGSWLLYLPLLVKYIIIM